MAVLKAFRGFTPGEVFPLEGDAVILGRHPDCDIVLESGSVSRQHARILKVGDEHFLEDLHSRNKTYVNDLPVTEKWKLSPGDKITICEMVLVFEAAAEVRRPTETPHGVPEGVQMVDDEAPTGTSTIMSKLEVAATGPLRLIVNPEAKLKALLQIGRDLSKALRMDDFLPKLVDNLFTIFLQADRGFIVLKDSATGALIPRAAKWRRGAGDQISLSRRILQGVMTRKEAILSADAATDSRFDMSQSIVDFQIHSMMCAPLVDSDGQVLGVIQIDTTDQRRQFNKDDLEVLVSVASHAAMAMENVQLHERRLHAELMERELALAHKVQRGLLPAGPPVVKGYEFVDLYEPANHLGGDYFDYIGLPGGRLAIALADVMGKGIAAALLMARLSAQVPYCLASLPTPADAMARLNTVFCEPRWEGRFVTLVMLLLDPARHQVTVVNAGHHCPLWRRATGQIEEVGNAGDGFPLGIDSDATYNQFTIELAPGESLTLFTDGIIDAMNAANERFGEDRLRAQLEQPVTEAHRVRQRLLDDLRHFVGNEPQTDDMCMTYLRRIV